MILAVTIWVITLVSVVLMVGRYWWFPEVASEHGSDLDRQFMVTLVVTGAIFVLAQVGLGYLLIRYRDRPGKVAYYTHGNDKLELIWTIATAVVFFAMVIPGQSIWASLYLASVPNDAIRIEVTGQQFAWNIRYPGDDNEFGRVAPEYINDDAGNPVGLDLSDPAAQDDLVLPIMAVPVNRPVQLLLRSKDVTHAFSVRELRVKQDLVPGLIIPIQFTATKTGRFEIACAELCGLQHYNMGTFLEVLPEADYVQWLQDQAEE